MTKTFIMKKNRSRGAVNAEWLALLKEAMTDSNEEVKLNNRYIYKGRHLGGFLVGVDQRNNEVLKVEIEKLGFIFSAHKRKTPNSYCKQFINDIKNTPIAHKAVLGIRFYRSIVPKKKDISEDIIAEINVEWLKRYNEVRLWSKLSEADKMKKCVAKWKKIRYNDKKNPEGKWLIPKRILGSSYYFAYTRKRNEKWMHSIQKYFSDAELDELAAEGYAIKK